MRNRYLKEKMRNKKYKRLLSRLSYFIRGALLEHWMYGQMERMWVLYQKLLSEVVSLRVDQKAGLERATEMPGPSVLEVNRLKQQLKEGEKTAKKMEEVL
ncbi:uncharacterized protein A4U43_C02F15340 [Asparagus officinalis]|uniref:Uncharacterized protein n=1 Tax=Asparagus officinalis TaxID=4686 RepID=A0A5P1FIN8_ASPOF|nr:uncharacterized protein A4U43_C02F15340 [Asparagus officinalis]